MATLKFRLNRKNSSGSYDTIHYETSSNIVMRSNGESVETALTRADAHENNKSNPHGVTAAQIGALANNPPLIELYSPTPYIDFHFNSSSADNTSRIIEQAGGQLNINGAMANNDKNVSIAQVRNIRAGTIDIGAGAALATGEIYLVYE